MTAGARIAVGTVGGAASVVLGLAALGLSGRAAAGAANASWTVAALLAVAGTLYAVRHVAAAERRAWAFLLAASACWLAGQLIWDAYWIAGAVPPTPSAADAFWFAYPVIAAAGLYRFAPIPRAVRLIALADVVAVATAAGAIVATALVHDAARAALGTAMTGIGFSVVYVAMGAVVIQAVSGSLYVLRDRSLLLVFAGISLQVLAFGWWGAMLVRGTYVAGAHPIDLLFTLGLVATAVGGLTSRAAPALRPFAQSDLRWRSILPNVALVGLLGVLAYSIVAESARSIQMVLVAGSGGVAAALFARMWLLVRERSALDDERARARDLLELRNRELDAFAYTASHDLKGPLVSIDGLAASLDRRAGAELDERSRLLLSRIRVNAQSLQRLINDLLEFARTRVPVAERLAVVETQSVVDEVVETYAPRISARGGRIDVDTAFPPLAIQPIALKQALGNLVQNALEHSAGPLHVRVFAATRNGTVEIAVEDDGPGIPAPERARVFDLFARGRLAHTVNPEGTGIGLALVKKITEAHGGTVRYEEAAVGGARFVLAFPTGGTA